MEAGVLTWTRGQDPDRREVAHTWRAVLPDGYLVTVSEMGIGDWGWVLTSPGDGFPCHMQYGFTSADAAKAAADLYVKENP